MTATINARKYIQIVCHFLQNSSSCPAEEVSYCPVEGFEEFTWDELAQVIGGWEKVESIMDSAWSGF